MKIVRDVERRRGSLEQLLAAPSTFAIAAPVGDALSAARFVLAPFLGGWTVPYARFRYVTGRTSRPAPGLVRQAGANRLP